MARYFKEQDIDEFRDCFYLNTRSTGQITKLSDLALIMQSLGMSPTSSELEAYFKEKDGKLSFADFLDIMHTHSKKERVPQEIINAFEAYDFNRTKQISVKDLKHVLCNWGDKLDQREVEKLFRETNTTSGYIKYHDFIKVISAPLPDY